MVFGTILSGCLFILPAAVTTGVLVGMDAVRASNNQQPIFTVPPGGGLGGGPGINGGGNRGDKIETDLYCDETIGVYPYVEKGYQQYTLNPNPWGWTKDTGGNLCMSVTTYQNGSYPSKTIAPEWSVTWQYPQGPPTQPVHAFPNIKLNADEETVMPIKLSDIKTIQMDVEWYYGVGNTIPTTVDPAALTSVDAATNVAIDMFLDDDSKKSTDPEKAEFEVMVWLGAFGAATQPIGLAEGSKATEIVNGVTFNLYYGQNGLGQTVLTWTVPTNTIANNFVGDLAPLVTYDFSKLTLPANIPHPSSNAYLGYIGMGSEALSSSQNITLSVPKLDMTVT